MSKRILVLLVTGAGLTVTTLPASAEPPARADESRRICRTTPRQLGSHIRPARRCRTAEQWRQEDEERAQMPASLQVTQGQNDGQPGRQPQ